MPLCVCVCVGIPLGVIGDARSSLRMLVTLIEYRVCFFLSPGTPSLARLDSRKVCTCVVRKRVELERGRVSSCVSVTHFFSLLILNNSQHKHHSVIVAVTFTINIGWPLPSWFPPCEATPPARRHVFALANLCSHTLFHSPFSTTTDLRVTQPPSKHPLIAFVSLRKVCFCGEASFFSSPANQGNQRYRQERFGRSAAFASSVDLHSIKQHEQPFQPAYRLVSSRLLPGLEARSSNPQTQVALNISESLSLVRLRLRLLSKPPLQHPPNFSSGHPYHNTRSLVNNSRIESIIGPANLPRIVTETPLPFAAFSPLLPNKCSRGMMASPGKSSAAPPSGLDLPVRPANSTQKENVPLNAPGMEPIRADGLIRYSSRSRGQNGARYQSQGSRAPPAYNKAAPVQLSSACLQNAASIRIRLGSLPREITTREIYDSLTQYGLQIAKVDILESDTGARLGAANIHIEPTPSLWPPWNGPGNTCTITRKDSSSFITSVHILAADDVHETIRTPLSFDVPRQKSFECRGLIFGMMASHDSMFNLPQYKYRDVRLHFLFFQLTIKLTFNVDLGSRWGVKFYKIPIEFAHIKKIIRVKKEGGGYALVIQLPSAPRLYAKTADVSASHDDGLSFWQERDAWQRQLEITNQPHRAKYAPAELQKNRKTVDICRWTTYYLDMDSSVVESGMGNLVKRLHDYNVDIGNLNGFDIVQPGQPVWKLLDSPESKTSWDLFNTIHLPFEIRYQLEACITLGLFNEYSITAEFLDKLLNDTSTGKPRDTDRARMMLEGVADQGVPYYNPMDIFSEPKVVHYWPTVKLPPQAAMVRRAVITPTGIHFKTPGVELTNRVLRKYSDLTDRFLRVQFTDELTFGKIWSCQGSRASDELYTRVLRVLLNGIKIGDRHYKILAWSNSQFREHGAFFFCANDHVTCDDIRDWMGDLKHIRTVGKFAARMGQCFTTTRQLSGISVPKIVAIDDIQRKTDGRVWEFTDGVGKISPFFAQMIAHEQNMINTPSCFQMRMGGCKGVLVVWPDVPANEVHIRPSQEKFKAPYNGLETIKVSSYSQATLNRQIIPLLSCLGVEDRFFLELLEEELREYEDAMTDPFKAATLLRQRIDENQISLVLADMVETFMSGREPFLWTVLALWKCWVLQRLKFKAAVIVKKSAFLYGCVDELGILRGHSKDTEGKEDQDKDSLPQIFLQVPREGCDPNNSNSYEVIRGICVVGRNPSLHPGDIRVVEAVDVPGLRHLKNVVVFPQRGDRDIPSMCSGGDLDGDDFFILWDQRLLPNKWHFPPMYHDADSSGVNELPHDIAINDMCAFFAQYMKNDSVGLVATAHVAWADKVGPQGEKCECFLQNCFPDSRLMNLQVLS